MSTDRPWLKNYPVGMPANIDVSQYESIVEFLSDCFKKNGNKRAFECMGRVMTYKQIDTSSTHFGAYLHSRGLKPGDRIALMMPNLLQYPIALFGALKAGLIIVNTNPLYTAREMEHQLTDSGVKAIVIAENFAHNLEKVLPKTEIDVVITTTIGELLGSVKGGIVDFMVKRVKRLVPKFKIANTVNFKSALKVGMNFSIKPFENCAEDVILHQYTGGTTGVSKGAMLTNGNLIANMLQIRHCLKVSLNADDEVSLSPLPMYHIFAFCVNCLAMMSIGAHTVLVTNARDLGSIVKEFKKQKITLLTGVNTLFNALLNFDDFKTLDFSELKLSVGGGMAVQKAVSDRWEEVTGKALVEGYGMTEASPVISINPTDGSAQIGTIGVPVPSTDMRIVNDQGVVLGVDEIGEIQVQGPQVMKGYYNRPEETASTILNGWLCTGDIGLMKADGFFKIVDRKKDMILVSGFNVFPNEIEDVVSMHPKVLEVAAIGVPHEKSGEVVKIFVVKKDKSLTEKELEQHCRENLTGYKVPKSVAFRKDLPKTNVGKILRRKLKDL